MSNYIYKLSAIISILILLTVNSNASDKNHKKILEEQLPYLLDASNAGTKFYLAFHPCWEVDGPNNAIRIYISSVVSTTVTLEIVGKGIIRQIQTIPNDVSEFVLSPYDAQAYSKKPESPPQPEKVWQGLAIKITSEAPIVVYGVTRYQYTSDGYLALPVSSLGKVYQVSSFADPTDNSSQFLPSYTNIVGAYDNTKVSFRLGGNPCSDCGVPRDNGDTLKYGQVMTKTLNEGDVWLIPGFGPNNDLTGSKIIADKPVAVISGNFCAYVPSNVPACDFTIEQELPEDSWGSKYYVTPIFGRKKYSVIKIFAKNPNTEVSLDNVPMWNIVSSGGTFGTGYITTRAATSDTIRPVIISSKPENPINVVQYNPGQTDDNVTSDPFQMQLTPVEQFQKEIVFNTPGIRGGFGFRDNYINIVYKASVEGKIPDHIYYAESLDGEINWIPLNAYSSDPGTIFKKDIPDADGRRHYCKTLKLPFDGVYRIKADEPFAAYAYGFSDYDSYGFPTSMAMAYLGKKDTIAPIISNIQQENDEEITGEFTDLPLAQDNRSNLSLIFMDPLESENIKLTMDKYIANEDFKVKWKLSKIIPELPSKAHLVINDRNGNRYDTIITINSVTPNYRKSDSLILVSIYNDNSGYKWTKQLNWLKNKPLEQWDGVKITDNRVSELNLEDKGLDGVLPADIIKLSKLKSLNVSNNPGCQIPSNISSFEELEYLNLSSMNLKTIPSFILSTRSLIDVNLSSNNINQILLGLEKNENLKTLNLANNLLDFSDLIPYKLLVQSQTFSFIYYPQSKVGNIIEEKVSSAGKYTINFGILDTKNNTYSWYLNSELIENKSSYTLTIDNFDKENTGTYILKITNSDFPLLTLESQECRLTMIPGKPIINTNSIYDITENKAKIESQLINSGGEEIKEKGVCINLTGNPTIDDTKLKNDGSNKLFVTAISNLLANKKYFVRSYASNNQGLSYSGEKSFTTSISTIEDEIDGIKMIQSENNIIISFAENQNIEYKLLDLNGNSIKIGNILNKNEIIISTIGLAKGVYFIELRGKQLKVNKKIIIN